MKNASKTQRYLVGVSGGADSVAMLHLLVAAGFGKLVVCHLDHRLRGRASTGDALFVARLASRLGLECEIGRADVKRRMKDAAESLETAARNARHDFFAECVVKYRCARVLLAHHADDQAETILWNLLRGSHGLKGMCAEQNIRVGEQRITLLRPLLDLRHAELVGFLQQHQIKWRDDATNAQPVAVRNRLRNEVFPLLYEISGRDAVLALTRVAEDFSEARAFAQEMLDAADVLDPQGRLHVPTLRNLPAHLQRAAFKKYLVEQGIGAVDRSLLNRAIGLLDVTEPASTNLPGGKKLRRRAGRIWVEFSTKEDSPRW